MNFVTLLLYNIIKMKVGILILQKFSSNLRYFFNIHMTNTCNSQNISNVFEVA